MSRMWSFYSYNAARFVAYFDGSVRDAAREVTDAVTWDDGAWRDPSVPRRLAARITEGGIRYNGLPDSDAAALDQLLPMLFAPEGLAEQWEVTPESPDGFHPSVVLELAPRAAGTMLLPVLIGGRRFGSSDPSACGYCFLSLADCERLVLEAERALGADRPWSAGWVPDVVSECLIDPLRSAVSKGRPVFGSLG
jgi:hypothetical protein